MRPEQSAMPFVNELSDYEKGVREWGVSNNSLYQKCVRKWAAMVKSTSSLLISPSGRGRRRLP